jgi:hypothetical protein
MTSYWPLLFFEVRMTRGGSYPMVISSAARRQSELWLAHELRIYRGLRRSWEEGLAAAECRTCRSSGRWLGTFYGGSNHRTHGDYSGNIGKQNDCDNPLFPKVGVMGASQSPVSREFLTASCDQPD